MRASVVVVIHSGADRLADAVASLGCYERSSDVEVVLVDNGSPDRCGDEARRRFPWLEVVRSERNLGFAGGVHRGVEAARGEILLLLNDDAAAENGWVEAHLDVLDRHPEAAVSAGRLVSWDASRHDFVRVAVTFDAHAFQVGQGAPIAAITPPEPGEPLPVACGGNMAVRRRDWERAGGFDRELFAYFEDLDLSWRLLAMGRQVVAAPDAVARHRGAATSALLGDFKRGVLFERNALRTFFACADDELRSALGNAVLATFLHRLVAFARQRPELAPVVADPFGAGAAHASRSERWRRRLREKGVAGSLRHLLARAVLGPRAGRPHLGDDHLLMQLRAADGFFRGLADAEERRSVLAGQRTLPDRAILGRFPRLVVPTYAGDDEWFASSAFLNLLPEDWPLEFKRLDEVVHPSMIS